MWWLGSKREINIKQRKCGFGGGIRTSLRHRKTNDQVVEEMNEKRILFKRIEEKRQSWLGTQYAVATFCVCVLIFEGKILGKKPFGLPRASVLQSVIIEKGCGSSYGIWKLVVNRRKWLQQQCIALRWWWYIISHTNAYFSTNNCKVVLHLEVGRPKSQWLVK